MSGPTCTTTTGCDSPIRYKAAQLCHNCYMRAHRRGANPGAVNKSGPCPHECGRPWHPLEAIALQQLHLPACPGSTTAREKVPA